MSRVELGASWTWCQGMSVSSKKSTSLRVTRSLNSFLTPEVRQMRRKLPIVIGSFSFGRWVMSRGATAVRLCPVASGCRNRIEGLLVGRSSFAGGSKLFYHGPGRCYEWFLTGLARALALRTVRPVWVSGIQPNTLSWIEVMSFWGVWVAAYE